MEIKEIREFIKELNTAAVILINNKYDTTANNLTKVAGRLTKAADILEQITKEQEPFPPGYELTKEDVPRLKVGETKIEVKDRNEERWLQRIYCGYCSGSLISWKTETGVGWAFARIPLPEKQPQWKKGDPIVVWENKGGVKYQRYFFGLRKRSNSGNSICIVGKR